MKSVYESVYEVWMRKTLLRRGYRPNRDSRTVDLLFSVTVEWSS